MRSRVLVTEADGHLGHGLVENLHAHGYDVSAGVRGSTDERKIEPLRMLGAKIIDIDVARPDKLAPAMAGVEGLFHCSTKSSTDPQHPTSPENGTTHEEGVLNVLAAARNAGVRRIVLTSCPATSGAVETRAWEFTRANGMHMVAVEPAVILGPGFRSHSPSTETLERILRGKLPALPRLNANYVDVRDAAELHRLAFESEDAHGSYPATGIYARIEDLANLIEEIDPSIHVPHRLLPTWLLRPAALLDAMASCLLGARRRLSPALLAELDRDAGGASRDDDAARALGWAPRPFRETLADTLAWIRQTFIRT
jgi:dihydroflavonol-4-reductase